MLRAHEGADVPSGTIKYALYGGLVPASITDSKVAWLQDMRHLALDRAFQGLPRHITMYGVS
eukprot:scaffold386551_cov20-Prasinocladus_malaysianus.AAC.1